MPRWCQKLSFLNQGFQTRSFYPSSTFTSSISKDGSYEALYRHVVTNFEYINRNCCFNIFVMCYRFQICYDWRYTTCVSMCDGSRPSWSLGTVTNTMVYITTRGTMRPANTFTCIIVVLSYTLVVIFLCKKNAVVKCVPFGRLFMSVHFYSPYLSGQ